MTSVPPGPPHPGRLQHPASAELNQTAPRKCPFFLWMIRPLNQSEGIIC